MNLLLALDGGGTKTDLAAADRRGTRLGAWRVGPTSLSRRSAAEVERELAEGCAQACAELGCQNMDFTAVGAGFASAGRYGAVYEAMLSRLLPRARIRVLTDAEIAWRGATGGANGLIVIAGTGSIAWGRREGHTAQAGGAGPGQDPGSGDWIGREAVAAGLAPRPADGNFAAVLPGIAGERGATAIFRQAGIELAGLLEACARRLDWDTPVAYPVGGVFAHVPAVLESLRAAWPHPLLPAQAPPIAGALAMGKDLGVRI